jgi:hypothetical protein
MEGEKQMSQRESGYARRERDLYETPEWVTAAVVPHIPMHSVNGLIWECAAGSGQMARVLEAKLRGVVKSDIDDGTDFLQVPRDGMPIVDKIVTNPPYELATEFCEHALHLMEPVAGAVAMLLRTDFDHAKSRAHLFRDCPAFAKKLVLMRRICWFVEANGKPKASPSFNHAWYIWDWRHEGPPTIGYGP